MKALLLIFLILCLWIPHTKAEPSIESELSKYFGDTETRRKKYAALLAKREDIIRNQWKITLGDDAPLEPSKHKLKELDGITLSQYLLIQDGNNVLDIVKNNQIVGKVNTIYNGGSIENTRCSLLQHVLSKYSLKKLENIQEYVLSPQDWACSFFDSYSIFSIDNLGGIIFWFKREDTDLSYSAFFTQFVHALRNKPHPKVKYDAQAVKQYRLLCEQSEAEWQLARKKEEAEYDRLTALLGFPSFIYNISTIKSKEPTWLAKQVAASPQFTKIINNDDIHNVFHQNDMPDPWKQQIEQCESKQQGIHFILKNKNKDQTIVVYVARFTSPEEAKARITQARYYDYVQSGENCFSEEQVKIKTDINPRLVGEFDLSLKHQFDESGCVIPKSNESAIYFQRGDTAVMLASQDPSISMLPLAKQIDKILMKKLQIAPSK